MDRSPNGPDLSLSPNQETLLRTALSSNPRGSPQSVQNHQDNIESYNYNSSERSKMENGPALYPSPPEENGAPEQISGLTDSPLFDDLDDGNFEWDGNAEQLFGDIQGYDYNEDGELHDKRKASTGSEDGESGSNKKQEGDSRTPKKPGRKPLTAEPTTKRKAQNRAAQRAFRERKERHLKDLETKVEDLEKSSEAANHENGRLRAQVDKLSTELTEYRKRLSLNSTGANSSPPPAPRRNHSDNNDFSFAFPKFGDLPGASFLNNGSLARTSSSPQGQVPTTSTALRKDSSNSNKMASPPNANGPYPSPQNNGGSVPTSATSFNSFSDSNLNELTGLFSPSVLETASRTSSTDYMSYNGGQANSTNVRQASFGNVNVASPPRVHRQSSASATNSPASSMSHAGFHSSVGTTPEASGDSPEHISSGNEGDKATNGLNSISEESTVPNPGKRQLCEALATACGNSSNPIPPMLSSPDTAPAPSTVGSEFNLNGIDWLAQQNGGQFDPVLFGDYRDPQDNILNNIGDDFFTDAFPAQDFASPYNTGDALPSEPKRDLMKEIEVTQNGADDDVVPGEENKEYLDCGKLWDRVKTSDQYQSGEADMDNLCSELKSKAKCSGKGAVIERKDVDKILGPDKKQNDMFGGFI